MTFSKQKAFETAALGLIAQGVPSVDDQNNCMYRGPNGTKCGVGFLIPDSKYSPSFERSIPMVFEYGPNEVAQAAGVEERSDVYFLADLQKRLHDQFTVGGYGDQGTFVQFLKRAISDFAYQAGLAITEEIQTALRKADG